MRTFFQGIYHQSAWIISVASERPTDGNVCRVRIRGIGLTNQAIYAGVNMEDLDPLGVGLRFFAVSAVYATDVVW